jgi:hypothetical protein
MTTSIQQLPKDCLVQIFQYFPVEKREKLEKVCKLFQKIVLDPKFEKERTTAINIAEIASHYPKELVSAIGGPQALFNLNVVALTEKDDAFFYAYKKIWNPSRGENHRLILFQMESTTTRVMEKVMIKKNRSNQWVWQGKFIHNEWTLCAADFDYIKRLFSGQPCGDKRQQAEGPRWRDDGQTTMRLIKDAPLNPKKQKKSNSLLAD